MHRRTFLQQTAAASAALALASCTPTVLSDRRFMPGRFMMINISGQELDTATADLIQEYGIRGAVLFQGNMRSEAQTTALVSTLRGLIGPDALIGVDQEGGGVVRTRTLPFPPSAMSLGASNDPALTRAVGAATGRGLRSMGFNWDFAPSLDVNNNPLNPVIGDRSFSSDPERVRTLGIAWAEGLMEAGVASCIKHFPGHGDTQVDSHFGLPTVPKSRAELDALELLPFAGAVQAGLPCVMTSHIVFPALDPEHPATLSRPILTGLLRDEWGYEGVIVTDSLRMQAITDGYPGGVAARLALEAGADMVMTLGNLDEQRRMADVIVEAHAQGTLSDADFATRDARLRALAATYPVDQIPYTGDVRDRDEALMATAWERGLTAYRDPSPIAPGSPVTLVVPESAVGGGASDPGMSGSVLVARMSALYDLRAVAYDTADPLAAEASFEKFHRPGTPVVFATTSRHRLPENAQALAALVRPTLHLALWNPYAVLDVPAPALVTYGFRPPALDAVEAWLKGNIRATSPLPVDLGVS